MNSCIERSIIRQSVYETDALKDTISGHLLCNVFILIYRYWGNGRITGFLASHYPRKHGMLLLRG
jgi:hypothetical protein